MGGPYRSRGTQQRLQTAPLLSCVPIWGHLPLRLFALSIPAASVGQAPPLGQASRRCGSPEVGKVPNVRHTRAVYHTHGNGVQSARGTRGEEHKFPWEQISSEFQRSPSASLRKRCGIGEEKGLRGQEAGRSCWAEGADCARALRQEQGSAVRDLSHGSSD